MNKLKAKTSNITPTLVILLFVFLMYHAAVIKAMRVQEARQCFSTRNSIQVYELCKSQIKYSQTFFDFKKVFASLD